MILEIIDNNGASHFDNTNALSKFVPRDECFGDEIQEFALTSPSECAQMCVEYRTFFCAAFTIRDGVCTLKLDCNGVPDQPNGPFWPHGFSDSRATNWERVKQ